MLFYVNRAKWRGQRTSTHNSPKSESLPLNTGNLTQIKISPVIHFFSLCLLGLKSRLAWPKHKDKEDKKAKPSETSVTPLDLTPKVLSTRPIIPELTPEQRMRQTPFERVLYDMNHDQRVVNDLILGRRISFYELRGEIGCGNFSHVRLGIHALTKGKEGFICLSSFQ